MLRLCSELQTCESLKSKSRKRHNVGQIKVKFIDINLAHSSTSYTTPLKGENKWLKSMQQSKVMNCEVQKHSAAAWSEISIPRSIKGCQGGHLSRTTLKLRPQGN